MQADFEAVAQKIPGVALGKMFGKTSLMVGKKAIGCLAAGGAAFKLPPGPREEGLALAGAHLFDPAGQGRAMKEWVVVPHAHQAHWLKFGQAAYRYLTAE